VTTSLSTTGDAPAPPALATIAAALDGMRRHRGEKATSGLHPGLLVAADALLGPAEASPWIPATRLTDGTWVPALLEAARRRWSAQPHAAAALAWKSYTYWVALPAVAGYAAARRVPLMRPADVLVQVRDRHPLVTVGIRRAAVAVLPSDPLAAASGSGIRVVRDETALLAAFRRSLFDAHLAPVQARLLERVHLGRRTLLGSVAAAVAHAVVYSQWHAEPESVIRTGATLLDALGLTDLVELVPSAAGPVEVRRRTCCLAFTLPAPKICRDCCLRPADGTGVRSARPR
jgi:hypothetical protein